MMSILKRFPIFELSYETVSHKKVSVVNDSIALAIPLGRKYFIWYTYAMNSADDVCLLVGLDKDKHPISVEPFHVPNIPRKYCFGTVVYGTLYESDAIKQFLVEDIYQFCGINLGKLSFGDRIGFLSDFMRDNAGTFALPATWHVASGKEQNSSIPVDIAYTAHHVQYREIARVAPYINIPIPKKGIASTTTVIDAAEAVKKLTASALLEPIPHFDYSRPQFKYPAVFNVSADPQLDLYHLYAYGGASSKPVYCGLAGIQTMETSVFMNRQFRHIRENENLDLAEESEDEEEFENPDPKKYVDLHKIIPIKCEFNAKHKKWVPVSLANPNDKIVHIVQLIKDTRQPYQNNRNPYHNSNNIAHKVHNNNSNNHNTNNRNFGSYNKKPYNRPQYNPK